MCVFMRKPQNVLSDVELKGKFTLVQKMKSMHRFCIKIQAFVLKFP